jgi:hypothetical protein
MFKAFITILLLAALYSLASALFVLFRPDIERKQMVIALSWRIGLCVSLFGLLFLGNYLGLIHPHGLYYIPN